jgi:hypothetical protein
MVTEQSAVNEAIRDVIEMKVCVLACLCSGWFGWGFFCVGSLSKCVHVCVHVYALCVCVCVYVCWI